MFLLLTKTKLNRLVAVLFARFALNHYARTDFKDRHRHAVTIAVEYLRHSQFFTNKALHDTLRS